ncbi:hypothetical protein [Paenibacillus radicis (ex Gao et al. 2016)]|uniref:Uncharacterized protein n=1 Tax=Paenibacillus radicis (ex Gao et al. 2016) TaxID=1737354 RepID=A0A917GYK7_9BACL|nr:hypothetical protein [Paenibacillus radicis (ex Gao et al. 2016)]GGG61508.1 hypothetical protein GCM10010918_13780 [Paenibacillus radicis (ex Gao et al. 2016)]
MTKATTFCKVTGDLNNGELLFRIGKWKLLIETNRYYEIKPETGAVKRLYKEKLNTICEESKHFAHGFLSCSVFCREDHIHDMKLQIIHKLESNIQTYLNELALNQLAIQKQYHQLQLAGSPGEN